MISGLKGKSLSGVVTVTAVSPKKSGRACYLLYNARCCIEKAVAVTALWDRPLPAVYSASSLTEMWTILIARIAESSTAKKFGVVSSPRNTRYSLGKDCGD